LGANGSGKNTLAKHFNALLIPTEGQCQVNGLDTKNADNHLQIRKLVGFVFQNPDDQIVNNIVQEDVAFGPESLQIPSEEIRRGVDCALELIGMQGFKTHAPHMLSGGQKQKIAIAGVLALSPQAIIFDEPISMLDPKSRKEMLETIRSLHASGKTIILITHNMQEVEDADKIILLRKGEIVAEAPPKEIFENQELIKSCSLGLPPIMELKRLIAHDTRFQK